MEWFCIWCMVYIIFFLAFQKTNQWRMRLNIHIMVIAREAFLGIINLLPDLVITEIDSSCTVLL